MATTTTNFGWDIPQSTDLVKDGATAIAALGQDIDTALVDLKGGTTGQVLAKASNTDLDYTWVAQDDSNAIQNAIVDAKGDLIAATAADTPARLAVGTNGQVLTADSTAATGIKWATPASSGGMTLLATTTLSGTVVTISSLSTYKELWFVFRNVYISGNNYMYVQFNGDSGNNYSSSAIKVVGTTVSGVSYGVGVNSAIAMYVGDSATTTNRLSGVLRVSAADQTSGSSYTSNTGFNDGTGNTGTFINGRYFNTAVISSATFGANAASFSGGTILTYGVN